MCVFWHSYEVCVVRLEFCYMLCISVCVPVYALCVSDLYEAPYYVVYCVCVVKSVSQSIRSYRSAR